MTSTRRPTMLVLVALVLSVAPVASGGATAAAAGAGGTVAAAAPGRARATAAAGPSLRLLATQDEVTSRHPEGQPAFVDPGVFVAAVGGAFDLRIRRTDYDHPITVAQAIHTAGGIRYRPLPADVFEDWYGLKGFLHVELADATGAVIARSTWAFCPNTYDAQRVAPGGPDQPTFPYSCYSSPFTLGAVWGIDQDWGVNPFEFGGLHFDAPDGHYTLSVSVASRYAEMFDIPASDASATVGVRVVTVDCGHRCGPSAARRRGSGPPAPLPPVPAMASPDPSILPDLVPLPSWGIGILHRSSRDRVQFGATVWIGGNSPLDVEGFRRPGTDVMDAYQYFYRDGEPVGRARAGTMRWDPRSGHHHWHFEQFATYELWDSSRTSLLRSEKQGFCLAPTDSVDLLLPRATWRPDTLGFGTVCGGESAAWIRETLPLGWGDTYFQAVAGQDFDVTDLPNGTYYIAVIVNPTGELHETDTANDVSFRKIVLGGTPGNRTVTVPAWHGIDDEGCIPRCA